MKALSLDPSSDFDSRRSRTLDASNSGLLDSRIALLAGLFTSSLAVLVLLGWWLRITALQSLAPGLSSMKANTALCIFLLGLALALRASSQPASPLLWSSRLLAGLTFLTALLSLSEYIFHADFAIDQLLFTDTVSRTYPGRMGINTATALLCLAAASLLTGLSRARFRYLPFALALSSSAISLMAMLGYLFSVQSTIGFSSYTQMAVHTSICVLALSVGALSLSPIPGLTLLRKEREVSRFMIYKLLVFVFLAPLVVGWLVLWAERLEYFPREFSLAALAGALAFLLTACSYYAALRMAEISVHHSMAQEALRASEGRLRAILDTEPGCVKLLSADCSLLEMNKAGLAMIEADSPEQVLGASVLHLVDAPYRQKFRELTEQVFDGKSGTLEFEATGLRGARLWLETRATPLQDEKGAIESALGITRDITLQKISEQALRSSEKKFVSIFNSSPDAITISELATGTYVEANRAYLDMTGYSRNEIIGRSALELKVWADPEQRNRLSNLLQTRGSVTNFDADLCKRDGQIFSTQISAEIIELEGVQCLLVITRDVSERKALEAQLRQAQKMEAVGQLAGGVAHDFNNMLMIILSYAELIRNLDSANPKIPDYSDQILKAGHSAETITRQLLAFSRKQLMDFKIQDLNVVVRDLNKMLPRLIGENIEMVFTLNQNLPPVRVDRGQIEQVLINLAVNARDAMPKGGKLTIETGTKYFDRSYSQLHPPARIGHYVMLAVSDTGTGMDRETQSRIFEPFFTTKAVGKGTGLGLATVYGIVKQSDGFIWVYSEPGKGTAFKIYLPIVETVAQLPDSLQPESMPPSRGTETILLIEDESGVRSVIQEFLSGCGYVVLSAATGLEALQLCGNLPQSPSLVLSDAVMPGDMTGPEVIAAVRKLYPAIKSILMSGYTDAAAAHDNSDGVFIQKPISLRELSLKIRAMLDVAPPA